MWKPQGAHKVSIILKYKLTLYIFKMHVIDRCISFFGLVIVTKKILSSDDYETHTDLYKAVKYVLCI